MRGKHFGAGFSRRDAALFREHNFYWFFVEGTSRKKPPILLNYK